MTAFFPGRPPIDAYGNGGFRFAGLSHRGSILALPSGVYAWDADVRLLGAADVAAAANERAAIDLLILGTGTAMLRPPAEFRAALAAAGMGLDYMATAAAVSTYNVLLAENRKVAAALIAVGTAA